MFKGFVKKWISALFKGDLERAQNRLRSTEEELKAIRRRLGALEEVMGGLIVSAELESQGGSFVVIGYSIGKIHYVKLYDFQNSNVGAFRDMLEKFRKAGHAARVDTRFDKAQRFS